MVQLSEIGWGKYAKYEGPFYRGKMGVLVQQATVQEMAVMVTTAAEGGHYDAWNGYDSCGWTSGAIQWCERSQFSVSDMLGRVADENPEDLATVTAYAKSVDVSFEKNSAGKWRFKFADSRSFVDNGLKQQQLFYKKGDGTQGTWSTDTMLYAKGWAAAISSVWQLPNAQRLQREFTFDGLSRFFTKVATDFFSSRPMTPVTDAMYAAYTSFAVNNPSWASSSLQKAISAWPSTSGGWWSETHLYHLLKHLTFDPGIAIYPARYDAIRPALETLYGVNLPDFQQELQRWSNSTGIPVGFTTKQLQKALLILGFDLGPAKADGVYGKKTKDALFAFEQRNGVPPEKQDGMIDEFTYPVLEKVLNSHGVAMPPP